MIVRFRRPDDGRASTPANGAPTGGAMPAGGATPADGRASTPAGATPAGGAMPAGAGCHSIDFNLN